MASNLLAMASNLIALQRTSDGLQPSSHGLQPTSDGLQPSSNGLPKGICYALLIDQVDTSSVYGSDCFPTIGAKQAHAVHTVSGASLLLQFHLCCLGGSDAIHQLQLQGLAQCFRRHQRVEAGHVCPVHSRKQGVNLCGSCRIIDYLLNTANCRPKQVK